MESSESCEEIDRLYQALDEDGSSSSSESGGKKKAKKGKSGKAT